MRSFNFWVRQNYYHRVGRVNYSTKERELSIVCCILHKNYSWCKITGGKQSSQYAPSNSRLGKMITTV